MHKERMDERSDCEGWKKMKKREREREKEKCVCGGGCWGGYCVFLTGWWGYHCAILPRAHPMERHNLRKPGG
jgi:hypothetical protein